MYKNSISLKSWIIFVALSLVWGSSFILMKKGMEAFTSSQVAALRILLAFLFFLPIAFWHYKKEYLKHWKGFIGMGVFGNFIPAFLFTKAETVISSSLTGMLNSLTPLFTMLLGIAFYNAKASIKNFAGIILGLLGATGLLYFSSDGNLYGNIEYGLYVIAATICYAISVNVIRARLGGVNPVTASIWAMSFIGPLAGIYLCSTDFFSRLSSEPLALSSFGYTAILGVFGTAISVIFFNRLIHDTTAVFASSVTYFIPLVAIFWGVLVGEELKMAYFAFIGLILFGVYLINNRA